MVNKLILTQGSLAVELMRAAETIVGSLQGFKVLTLEWTDSIEEASRKTRAVLAEIEDDAQILILTDMYGGTPYNVAVSLAEPGRIEVVTGVNLPMVVRLGCPGASDKNVSELAKWIQRKARQSICRAGEDKSQVVEGVRASSSSDHD